MKLYEKVLVLQNDDYFLIEILKLCFVIVQQILTCNHMILMKKIQLRLSKIRENLKKYGEWNRVIYFHQYHRPIVIQSNNLVTKE